MILNWPDDIQIIHVKSEDLVVVVRTVRYNRTERWIVACIHNALYTVAWVVDVKPSFIGTDLPEGKEPSTVHEFRR